MIREGREARLRARVQFTSDISSALNDCGTTLDLRRGMPMSIGPKHVEVALSSELAVNLSAVAWQS
jgi:hypothetical protein